MVRQRSCGRLQLHTVLVLLLLTSASCWGFGKQKPSKLSSTSKKKPHALPPSTFVRIFALPSFEATSAQHRLGELLAASCKNHARVGGCKLYSAALGKHHVRILEFQDDKENRAVVAYMIQETEEAIETALQECAARHDDLAATAENGKDYRCFKEKAIHLPTRKEILEQMKEQLNKIGVYKDLATAGYKSIFLTADPRVIIYQESIRLVGDNGDPDFFTQKIRDSFRRIVEWLAWQCQQYMSLAEGSPVLYSHAEDLDNNEKDEIQRVLDFLEIEDLHVVEETVTAKRGEVRFQKARLQAELASLPRALMSDIDEFMEETLQDKRMLERYKGSVSVDRSSLWPPPMMLQHLATDNTLLVTAATCSYAPLVVNWIKHVHGLGVPCYMVVALDDEIYKFLHNWLPEHVVRAPPGFLPAVPRQYAAAGTPASRHVSRARLATLRAITEQGYNVAWSDADVAFVTNPYTKISRWFDLAVTWSGGKGEPLKKVEKVLGFPLKMKEAPDRRISPSFVFMRGTEAARQFLDKWWQAANSSHTTEDGMVLNKLLHEPEVTSALTITILPESLFPSADNMFANASTAFQKAWETEPSVWAHPDLVAQKQDKIELLTAGKYWKVVADDPMPKCKRPAEDYLADGTAIPVWPPADSLSRIAQDDTILVTSATCAYADLVTNWIKHIWDLQITCFFVAAADEPTAEYLGSWVPEHAAQIPDKMVNQIKKFAQRETPEYTKVVQSRPRVLRAILQQGYKAAWSDADIVWTRNPFTLFDPSPDLVFAWEDNSVVSPGGVIQPGDFPGQDKDRRVGTAFLFARPSSLTLSFMEKWAARLESSDYVDDVKALNELLREPEFKAHLKIGIFPSALFPTSQEMTADPPLEELEAAWEDVKPAWLHADSIASHEGKVKLFRGQNEWRVESGDPQPKCETWGRKLGDDENESELEMESRPIHQHHRDRSRLLR